ncbi:ABC transporter substrate-binding protein [Paenibacillus hemerocallicola]|nr:extracellular solute-binding protein [Paenibacillus hemerocallicola]
MKKKAAQWTLGGMLAVALTLTACGKTDNGTTADPNDSQAPVKSIAQEAAEVVFYSNNGDSAESFDYRFGVALRKKFPNWTITYIQREGAGTDLPDLLSAGTRFDIFFQSIGNFEAQAFPAGIQYDMTELIKRQGMDLSRLDATVVDAVKQASGGKLYGIPVFTNNLVLYYNKTIFDKFGVTYPKDGMRWEEMIDIAKKLTRNEGGVQYYGFSHSPTHTVRLNPLSIPNADLQQVTPTINKDERWKQFYQAFYLDPMRGQGYLEGIQKLNKIPDHNMFVKDKTVGMFAYLSSLVYVWEEQFKGVDWDMVALPTLDSQKGVGSQSYPTYFGLTAMARNKEASMEALNYLISDEFQAAMARKGIMPVLKNDAIQKELGQDSIYKDKNWKAVFYNRFAPIPPKADYDAGLVNEYVKAGNQIAFDKMDMNSALRQAEEEGQKKIAAFKSK